MTPWHACILLALRAPPHLSGVPESTRSLYTAVVSHVPVLTTGICPSGLFNFGLFFKKLALRAPMATCSPFGCSLAPRFGPDFENFRFYNFPIISKFSDFFEIFRFPIFRFFCIGPQMMYTKFHSNPSRESEVMRGE